MRTNQRVNNRDEGAKMRAWARLLVLAMCCWLALSVPVAAHDPANEQAEEATEDQGAPDAVLDEDASADELAKASQNPLASLITVPMMANFNAGVGDYDRRMFNLNVMPVIPITGKKWNVITRTMIPINSVPIDETGSVFGLGDINFNMYWTPAKASSLTWGIGPSLRLPTASNQEVLGSGKFSIGPTGVLFYGVGPWTMGAVASNVWSVAGESDRSDVNSFFAQWFINYNFGNGWALGTVPIITCDWNADVGTGDRCTIPFGLQISKVTKIGKQSVNLLVGYYENVRHPEGAADSQARIQINFMFPQSN